jgi:hypothetical protein
MTESKNIVITLFIYLFTDVLIGLFMYLCIYRFIHFQDNKVVLIS